MKPSSACIQLSESVVTADVDDELVLLDVEAGIYFGLDAVGAAIWQMLSNGLDAEGIVEQLAQQYDAPRERIHEDVTDIISDLVSHNLAYVLNE